MTRYIPSMPRIPTVAIIGRPNTGKSTLFNRLVGRRRAIVSDIPGTTRDQIAQLVEHSEIPYLLVDTGGLGGGSSDTDLEDDVAAQSLLAIESADLILFTVNGKELLTASDEEIASILRKKRKTHVPVILVVTKCDNPDIAATAPGYLQLGITDECIAVSATHNIGTDELQQAITNHLHILHFSSPSAAAIRKSLSQESIPRIAIIGKPNVGKSSLLNALMSDPERARAPRIVADQPGTTRDTTDTIIRHQEQEYLFVDTAGIKQRKGVATDIELYAQLRSVQAIANADIVLLIIDLKEPISRQDKRIAQMTMQEGKGLIILANKIDLLSTAERAEALQNLRFSLSFCSFAPIISCSTVTRDGLLKIFPLIEIVTQNRNRFIATKDLNNWFAEALQRNSSSELTRGKFITQAEGTPPTFVLFVSDPKKIRLSELKYLENNLRQHFAFEGTPIRWVTKRK